MKGWLFPPGILIIVFIINFFLVRNVLLKLLNFFSALTLYILSISLTSDFLTLFLKVQSDKKFDRPNVIFVLGAGLSDESISRIVKGYEIFKIYNVPIIISGYKVEAMMMKNKLLNLGIPDSFIILDSLARNTKENVKNFKKIASKKGFKNVIVISSFYHLKRIEKEFSNSNLNIKYIPSNPINYTAKTFLDFVPSYSSFSRNINYLNEIVGLFLISLSISIS